MCILPLSANNQSGNLTVATLISHCFLPFTQAIQMKRKSLCILMAIIVVNVLVFVGGR